jgi:NAD(P)-dependent dehydrogenase (short-subunit alcohol dehydrogenase family)
MPGQLNGKVCLITGGGTGIGKCMAGTFAKEGAKLILASRNKENLERTAGELREEGAAVLVVPTDITQEDQVVRLFAAGLSEYGQLDIVVCNSATNIHGPIHELSLKDWQQVIDVNLTGTFLCGREAMKIMIPAGSGRILIIGSISATVPRIDAAAYNASKHALIGLTKSMALEGREHGIPVSILHPGNVLTEKRQARHLAMDDEPMLQMTEIANTALTMVSMPSYANLLEATVLPVKQKYLGRG